ncbi:type II toxin-antitoxin system RelE/ParE family toxin (plasmid) [Vibrio coralliilyticus]|nr:type II toxin-antitoxin system RelE/ParE family toxin [Vibrio coralliilyticus]WFB50995.1 type II toxin-antitoxin system RelE/ParE family toxin [Vibrio coralliilyticus]
MTYKLDFKKSALKEWKKLGSTLQQQFKKKLIERLDNPHVPASKLSGADNMYKIKLRQSGYRLVYKVEDNEIDFCLCLLLHYVDTISIEVTPFYQVASTQHYIHTIESNC